MRNLSNFDSFLSTARQFWSGNTLPAGSRVILLEAMSQDLRVTLRNLTVANALRRFEPAHLVVFSGADEDWNQVVWTYFNLDEIRAMCDAYGAEKVFDAHELVNRRVQGERVAEDVLGVDIGGELPDSGIPADVYDRIVYATACRMARVARIDDEPALQEKLAQVERRSREFAKVYDRLFAELDVLALVSSHVDYNNFGLAVEAALRHDVPVLFPQSTGGLKAYALFPEHHGLHEPIRAGLTRRIGEFFNEQLWPRHEELSRSAELTMWRAKSTLGRPSWWRSGQTYSSVDLRGHGDRAEIRTYAARRTRLDPDKPTVSVFNHAVSDALGTNLEAFGDLGEWFEATAEFARDRDEVNWLFLDHPQQSLYDEHEFFANVASRHVDRPHMRFMRSMDLSKNFLTALTDLVLTVRGSVSNEYPTLGIPALQCGWSEWSMCGFTTVADDQPQYWAELDRHIRGLIGGETLITPEQVERARLWGYFYRAVSDVPSGLVQQWPVGEGDQLFDLLGVNMLHMEADAEPAFASVRRLWKRREAFLTRVDWTAGGDGLLESLATVGEGGASQ